MSNQLFLPPLAKPITTIFPMKYHPCIKQKHPLSWLLMTKYHKDYHFKFKIEVRMQIVQEVVLNILFLFNLPCKFFCIKQMLASITNPWLRFFGIQNLISILSLLYPWKMVKCCANYTFTHIADTFLQVCKTWTNCYEEKNTHLHYAPKHINALSLKLFQSCEGPNDAAWQL